MTGNAKTLNGAIRYFAYAIKKPSVARAAKNENASYRWVNGRYRTSIARRTIEVTWSMNPTITAPRAGLKNVCFLLRVVRTECTKPTQYRPSASLSKTTCMAGIIAHACGDPVL